MATVKVFADVRTDGHKVITIGLHIFNVGALNI